MSSTDKSPPHTARQCRDMGSGGGREIRGGVQGKMRCGKRNKRQKCGKTEKNRTGVFIHTNDKKEKRVSTLKQKPDCLCKKPLYSN